MNDAQATTPADADSGNLDVVVVGAGFGGMYAIHHFRRMGLKVVGIEAGGDVGGVWYWNRYPGARCDLMCVDYSYSFSREIELEWTWPEQFASQKDILAYANFVADRLDLRRHFRFRTRVTRAVWDEGRQKWRVTTDGGETFEATYCVMSTGPLSIPKDPEIPGLGRFKGQLLRAAKWPHEDLDFGDKRVGLIGTGSTGVQIVTALGTEAKELYVFQRTPSFSFPMRNRTLSAEYIEEMRRHYPALREAARNSALGGVRPAITRPYFSVPPDLRKQILEDAWAQGGHSFIGSFSDLLINPEANEAVAEFVRGKISEVVTDPTTAEALKPRGYPILARRPCLDTEYYEMYNRPNVHLVDCLSDPIEEITESGIRTRSGEVALDTLILATGYDGLTGALLAFEVIGREGRRVNDKWKAGSRSYLGLMMEGFPNLFMTCGPNGPAALANIITLSEHDVDWIGDVITHMRAEGVTSIEPRREAEDGWMETVNALAQRTLVSKAKTWYVGANVEGKPQGLTLYTGGFVKYREQCAAEAQGGYRGFVLAGARVAAE